MIETLWYLAVAVGPPDLQIILELICYSKTLLIPVNIATFRIWRIIIWKGIHGMLLGTPLRIVERNNFGIHHAYSTVHHHIRQQFFVALRQVMSAGSEIGSGGRWKISQQWNRRIKKAKLADMEFLLEQSEEAALDAGSHILKLVNAHVDGLKQNYNTTSSEPQTHWDTIGTHLCSNIQFYRKPNRRIWLPMLLYVPNKQAASTIFCKILRSWG